MRVIGFVALLVLSGCVATDGGGGDGSGGGQPVSAAANAVTTFDGRYPGRAETVSGCGAPSSRRIVATVTNGALVIPMSDGQRVTGHLTADGRIERLAFSNPVFLVQGSGRMAGGAYEITLSSRNMYYVSESGCEFRYTGRRAS